MRSGGARAPLKPLILHPCRQASYTVGLVGKSQHISLPSGANERLLVTVFPASCRLCMELWKEVQDHLDDVVTKEVAAVGAKPEHVSR